MCWQFTRTRSNATADRTASGTPACSKRLYRPQTGYYRDLVAEAAALWESLSQNHPFVDGNKRTAFAAVYTFLAINGVRITAAADSVYSFISDLYESHRFAFDALAEWLRQHTQTFS